METDVVGKGDEEMERGGGMVKDVEVKATGV